MGKVNYQLATWKDLHDIGYRLPKNVNVESNECITYGDLETTAAQTDKQYTTNNIYVDSVYNSGLSLIPYYDPPVVAGTAKTATVRIRPNSVQAINGDVIPFYTFSVAATENSTVTLNIPLTVSTTLMGAASDLGSNPQIHFELYLYYGATWEDSYLIGRGTTMTLDCRTQSLSVTCYLSCSLVASPDIPSGQNYYVGIRYYGTGMAVNSGQLSLPGTIDKVVYIDITFTEKTGNYKIKTYSKDKCVPWNVVPGAKGQSVSTIKTSGQQPGTGVYMELGIYEDVSLSTNADEITVTYYYKVNGAWNSVCIYSDYDIGDGSKVDTSATKVVNMPLNINGTGTSTIEDEYIQFFCGDAGGKQTWYYRVYEYVDGGGTTTTGWQRVPGTSKTCTIQLNRSKKYADFVRKTQAVHFYIT